MANEEKDAAQQREREQRWKAARPGNWEAALTELLDACTELVQHFTAQVKKDAAKKDAEKER